MSMASDQAYAPAVRWSDDFLRMRRARSAFRRRLAVGLPGGDVELRAWLERCGQEWVRAVVIDRCATGAPDPAERAALVTVLRRVGVGLERERVESLSRESTVPVELRRMIGDLLEDDSVVEGTVVEGTVVEGTVVEGTAVEGVAGIHGPDSGAAVEAGVDGDDPSAESALQVPSEGPGDLLDRWCERVLLAVRGRSDAGRALTRRLHSIGDVRQRAKLMERFDAHRRRYGIAPGVAYRRLLTAEAATDLRAEAVRFVVEEARFADIMLLQFLRRSATDEEQGRLWQRAWLEARTRATDHERKRVDTRAWVSSCDGRGSYQLLVEQRPVTGPVLVRFKFAIGNELLDTEVGASPSGLRRTIEGPAECGSAFAAAPLPAADGLVVDAARQGFELQGAIPGDTLSAIGQLDPVLDESPPPTWRWLVHGEACSLDELLARPEYQSWRFDAEELAAHGVSLPQTNSVDVSAVSEVLERWCQRAAVRLDVACMRRRLISMLEHMRGWHVWRREIECARRCSIAVAELVDDFARAPIVRAMVRGSIS